MRNTWWFEWLPRSGDVLRTMQGQQGPRFNLGQTPRVEKFEAKTYTVHTVREVYRTEFDSVPLVFFLPNNRSGLSL